MNYDWKSHDWTIPLNMTVSKTVMFGNLPVKLQMKANYYVEQPDLFGDIDAAQATDFDRAVDEIRDRFGNAAVARARTLERP